MVSWTKINAEKIKRVGYNKEKETLFIDFNESETDSIFLNVPEALYQIFIEIDFPDQFYDELVEGYFDTLSPGVISSAKSKHHTK